ncbi:MAG: hypothetical protein R3A51_00835 [Nannocystaceae bacterium]
MTDDDFAHLERIRHRSWVAAQAGLMAPERFARRLLTERDRSRESGDALAQAVARHLKGLLDALRQRGLTEREVVSAIGQEPDIKLVEALRNYCHSERWAGDPTVESVFGALASQDDR